MAKHLELGKAAERLAEKWFLESRQARLIARNFRTRRGEIDLIFEELRPQDQKVELVFVEVRARSKDAWVSGAESIRQKKEMRLSLAIQEFLRQYRGSADTLRVDVLSLKGDIWEHRPHILLTQNRC